MAQSVAIFLFASMAIGSQNIDEASCSSALVEPDRSLIQHQKAWSSPSQVAESAAKEGLLSSRESQKQDPRAHSIEFASGVMDMSRVTMEAYSDYPSPDSGVTGNVTKEAMLISLGPNGVVIDSLVADVRMYGFTNSTAGLKNVNDKRIWRKDPSLPGAELVYGITIAADANDFSYEWRYHIEFSNSQPAALKAYPEGGRVGKVGKMLVIALVCDDILTCKDGSFTISAIQLTPQTSGMLQAPIVYQESPAMAVFASGQALEASAGSVASKTSPSKQASIQSYHQCPLPPNAQWGEVRLEGLPPFKMALRTGDDVLSGAIMRTGNWPELTNVSVYGPPGNALDIGGNIGYYTFALAHGGWKVYTFEPMSENLALLKATLCENPSIAANVKLFEVGLSQKDATCTMMVNPKNRGNGQVMCGDTSVWPDGEVTGQFSLRRLEDILAANPISSVDFMKLDVEGYECEAMKGAPSFFEHYRPRLVKTEVWHSIASCTPQEYLQMFMSKGYKLANEEDMECKNPLTGPEETHAKHNGVADFYLCSS